MIYMLLLTHETSDSITRSSELKRRQGEYAPICHLVAEMTMPNSIYHEFLRRLLSHTLRKVRRQTWFSATVFFWIC